ncbi:MAG: hypothetical protein AVDCRST_MAG17-2147 [uncultured Solirubrobacterales bacterium]|uniref:Uncharacterized protein n=1 Tax=uncultured Solirubrobacterales bacterium TaxID=768556 RepID=A0A6J4T5C3_9ACTN|nr:MAG: hypothetical protein AVDCRST_MAG17-2147 [uncultured Solirubrobacterales bacterium]
MCALARTLDVAGDRWPRLVVRELAPSPRRSPTWSMVSRE